MNKKVFLLASICALGLGSWDVQAYNPQPVLINKCMEDNHIPAEAKEIRLLGKLNYNAGPDDIEAGATDNAVYLYFNQNFGNVSITLYNPTGILVYNCVVDTSIQQLVVIPIASSVSGTYTVVLDNANGLVEGDFEHD